MSGCGTHGVLPGNGLGSSQASKGTLAGIVTYIQGQSEYIGGVGYMGRVAKGVGGVWLMWLGGTTRGSIGYKSLTILSTVSN